MNMPRHTDKESDLIATQYDETQQDFYWDYHTVISDGFETLSNDSLGLIFSEWGDRGWELVSTQLIENPDHKFPSKRRQLIYIFKRPQMFLSLPSDRGVRDGQRAALKRGEYNPDGSSL